MSLGHDPGRPGPWQETTWSRTQDDLVHDIGSLGPQYRTTWFTTQDDLGHDRDIIASAATHKVNQTIITLVVWLPRLNNKKKLSVQCMFVKKKNEQTCRSECMLLRDGDEAVLELLRTAALTCAAAGGARTVITSSCPTNEE